jgi:hypothetical protein
MVSGKICFPEEGPASLCEDDLRRLSLRSQARGVFVLSRTMELGNYDHISTNLSHITYSSSVCHGHNLYLINLSNTVASNAAF